MNTHDTIRTIFEQAYEDHLDEIFYFLCARTNDREQAKELAQETFMRTWKYLAEGNEIANIRPFLYTTAYNLFKNELRRKRDTVSLETAMSEFGLQPKDGAMTNDRATEARLLADRMQELSRPYRDTLSMRYLEGLAVKEIAEIRGETPVTVSVRLHRGMHELRKRYAYGTRPKTT